MTVLRLKPNHITHKCLRERREKDKLRLIKRIGVQIEDAPLHDEQLRFLAYEESLRK